MFAAAESSPDGNTARILIVEDEGIIAGHIATRLQRTGYTVAGIFDNSDEVLARLPELNPDLVLMDIRIRGAVDGIATAHKIRERFDVPVIYLTAHTDRHTVDRAKMTGAFGFLTKPIHHTSLATSIEMALSKHASDRAMRQQRAWLETVLGSMADCVAVVDSKGGIKYLNRPAESMTGWSNEDAHDRDIEEIIPGTGQWMSGLADASPTMLPEGTEACGRAGNRFAVEGETAASMDGDRMVGLVITFRDATARSLEERRRRQEAKMQALGRLAACIAHDFNNLLFVIMGFAEEMERPGRSLAASRESLSQIRNAAETAAGITRQLLQFSRPEAGEMQIISLNSAIEETRELWRRMPGPHIQCELRLDTEPALVQADPAQLKQVVMNLTANAKDAMEHGGVLMIETRHCDSFAIMTIRDTGAGMTSEVTDRIFEPYFTTKPEGRGTGLGLAIVHRIVTGLNGTIRVVSEPGRGAAFTIQLPRAR